MGSVTCQPHGVSEDDRGVQAGVCSGGLRLPKPPGCPDVIYDNMLACWGQRPTDFSTFRQLRLMIQEAILQLRLGMVGHPAADQWASDEHSAAESEDYAQVGHQAMRFIPYVDRKGSAAASLCTALCSCHL